MGEKPSNIVDLGEEPSGEEKKTPDLDNPQSADNKKYADDFRKDFADKMSGNQLELSYKQGSVEYKYTLRDNGNGTVTITRINESERKEKADNGLPPPESKKTTVTFQRLYTNTVVGFPEIGKILRENTGTSPPPKVDDAGTSDDAESPKAKDEDKGKKPYQIEVGAMLPTMHDRGASGDDYRFGGQLVGRYILTDPTKSYVALTMPIEGQWGTATAMGGGKGSDLLADTTYRTFSVGLGVEAGWKPASALTFYTGAGARVGLSSIEYTNVNQHGTLTEDSTSEFQPGVFVAAGVRINPTDWWHIYGGVQPTKTFGTATGVNIPVFGGTGISF